MGFRNIQEMLEIYVILFSTKIFTWRPSILWNEQSFCFSWEHFYTPCGFLFYVNLSCFNNLMDFIKEIEIEMVLYVCFLCIIVIFTSFLCLSPGSDPSIKFLWIFFPGNLTHSSCYGGPCNTKTNHGKSHKIFNCEFK